MIYSCFLVTIFPPIVQLHFLHINPHTTHNSSNRSDEGLTLYGGQFTLSTQLIILNYPVITISAWIRIKVRILLGLFWWRYRFGDCYSFQKTVRRKFVVRADRFGKESKYETYLTFSANMLNPSLSVLILIANSFLFLESLIISSFLSTGFGLVC